MRALCSQRLASRGGQSYCAVLGVRQISLPLPTSPTNAGWSQSLFAEVGLVGELSGDILAAPTGASGNVQRQREAGFVRVDIDVPSGPVPPSDGAVKPDFALPYKVGLEFDAGRQIDAADPSAPSPPADFALLLLLDDLQLLDTKCAQPTLQVSQLVPPPERPPPTTAAPPAVVVVTTRQATTVTTRASTSSIVAATSNMAAKDATDQQHQQQQEWGGGESPRVGSFATLMVANWSRPVIILMLAVLIAMLGALLLVLSGRFCCKKRRPMCQNFFAQCECCCWSWHSRGLSCCYCQSWDKKYSDNSQNATARAHAHRSLSSEDSDAWNASPTGQQLNRNSNLNLNSEQQQLLLRQTSGDSAIGATLSTSTMSSPRLHDTTDYNVSPYITGPIYSGVYPASVACATYGGSEYDSGMNQLNSNYEPVTVAMQNLPLDVVPLEQLQPPPPPTSGAYFPPPNGRMSAQEKENGSFVRPVSRVSLARPQSRNSLHGAVNGNGTPRPVSRVSHHNGNGNSNVNVNRLSAYPSNGAGVGAGASPYAVSEMDPSMPMQMRQSFVAQAQGMGLPLQPLQPLDPFTAAARTSYAAPVPLPDRASLRRQSRRARTSALNANTNSVAPPPYAEDEVDDEDDFDF